MCTRLLTFLLFILCWGFQVIAQSEEKTPYYISINNADGKRINDIVDETLSLEYNDAYGRWKEVPLRIYDWKRMLVATLSIDKAYGLNSFVINLKDIYGGWELNKVYTCTLKDESGRVHELAIRLVPPPEKKDPEVNIMVNPVQMECDGVTPNVVEFYGEIKGGKAPYTVSWFVLNSSRNDFLYQPRQETIANAGKTMVITVDKSPEYSVVLHVKDACGNTQQKAVNLVCEDSRKKINTIFVEEKSYPMSPKKMQ
jgi:hypothetical protein